MKTIQVSLDEALFAEVDRTVRKLRTTRSAFARRAFREALHKLAERSRERRQIEGYHRKPVKRGEFSDWEREQAWPEP